MKIGEFSKTKASPKLKLPLLKVASSGPHWTDSNRSSWVIISILVVVKLRLRSDSARIRSRISSYIALLWVSEPSGLRT